ncbi:hypothetical protein MAPG_04741, partial [Magnaporthiopsis poae ATCC 64411]
RPISPGQTPRVGFAAVCGADWASLGCFTYTFLLRWQALLPQINLGRPTSNLPGNHRVPLPPVFCAPDRVWREVLLHPRTFFSFLFPTIGTGLVSTLISLFFFSWKDKPDRADLRSRLRFTPSMALSLSRLCCLTFASFSEYQRQNRAFTLFLDLLDRPATACPARIRRRIKASLVFFSFLESEEPKTAAAPGVRHHIALPSFFRGSDTNGENQPLKKPRLRLNRLCFAFAGNLVYTLHR